MSLSTAIIVNLVLDAMALGALAYVCRMPFRLGVPKAPPLMPSRMSQGQRPQRAG